MKNKVLNFLQDEQGASSAEYAIMVSLIAVVIIMAVTFLGLSTNDLFDKTKNEFENL